MAVYVRKELKSFIKVSLFVILHCVLLGTFIYYSNIKLMYAKSSYNINLTRSETLKVYKILFWTRTYEGPDWFGLGHETFKQCKYKNCLTHKNKYEYNTSDVIMFTVRYFTSIPEYRFPWQKWILNFLECPVKEPKNFAQFNGLFNTTMTYVKKADIYMPYSLGYFVKRKVQLSISHNFAEGRTKAVAWFNSHCGGQSKRHAYVRKLQKYIPVDIYGNCGPLKCQVTELRHHIDASKECDSMLSENYKFYLAFENSICQDYVSEKIWRAINYNIIPIVLGGFNYSSFFPPYSYIDVKDFRTPKDLAEDLLMLQKDDTKYNAYFQWKKSYKIEYKQDIQCEICEYLNRNYDKVKTYDRLDQFWSRANCLGPKKYYKNIDENTWI